MNAPCTTLAVAAATAAFAALAVLPAAVAAAPASAQESRASPTPSPTPSPMVVDQPSQSSPPPPSPTATWTISASPRQGCGAPSFQSINVEPMTATPGDTVTVTVQVRDEPCYPDESKPHDVQLFAQPEGDRDPYPVTRGTTDATGRFVYMQQVYRSVTYYLSVLDGVRRGGSSSAHVTVDRTGGSCANALTLYAAPGVPVGTPVLVHGNSRDNSPVGIAFRKRGHTTFTVRRHVVPAGEQGTFKIYFTPDDDYRLYAFNDYCDSQPILVVAAPIVSGPVGVRTGSVVTLTVRATPGMAVGVAFRREGQSTFTIRRTGTTNSSGYFHTTYRADADYEYYALEQPGQRSESRITQAR